EKGLSLISLRNRQQEASESALSDMYMKNEFPSLSSPASFLAKSWSRQRPSLVNKAAVTTGKVRIAFVRSRLNQFMKKSCNCDTEFQSGLVKSGNTKSPNIDSK